MLETYFYRPGKIPAAPHPFVAQRTISRFVYPQMTQMTQMGNSDEYTGERYENN